MTTLLLLRTWPLLAMLLTRDVLAHVDCLSEHPLSLAGVGGLKRLGRDQDLVRLRGDGVLAVVERRAHVPGEARFIVKFIG